MFLQAIFYSTLAFLQDIAVFLQVMGVFLPPIFCSTLSLLQYIAVFLQVMGVFLPPIFYSTWASSRTLPSSSGSLGALLAHCLQHLGAPRRPCCAFPRHGNNPDHVCALSALSGTRQFSMIPQVAHWVSLALLSGQASEHDRSAPVMFRACM